MSSTDFPTDRDIVRALSGQLPNDAQRIAWVLHGSAAELWRIHLAASGQMRYPDQFDTEALFPDGEIRGRGLRRYQFWRAALLEVLNILGPRESFLRLGYQEAEMRQAVERFFDNLERNAPLDPRRGERVPAEVQRLMVKTASSLPPQVLHVVEQQADMATIHRWRPAMVEVSVPDASPRINLPDGPSPGMALVLSKDDPRRTCGSLVLWIRNGAISGLEQDEVSQPSAGWPPVEFVRIFQRPDF